MADGPRGVGKEQRNRKKYQKRLSELGPIGDSNWGKCAFSPKKGVWWGGLKNRSLDAPTLFDPSFGQEPGT